MKRLHVAVLLASVALTPAALAQTSATPVAPTQAMATDTAMADIRVLIVRADDELERRDSTAAGATLSDADDNLRSAIDEADGTRAQEFGRIDGQLQAARRAVEENRLTEARRILVVILEDQAMVETADASARLRVEVPEPSVTVEQADPNVTVQQASPQVAVDPGRPQVTVNQAAPQVRVQMPQPTITIDMPRPEIIVEMPDPDVTVGMAQPRVTVNQAQPTVSVEQGAPAIALGAAQTIGTRSEDADVTIEQGQANVAVQPSQAVVDVAQTEPQVRYNTAEPDIQIESAGDPVVRFQQSGESNVQIRQMGEETTEAVETDDSAAATETAPAQSAAAVDAQDRDGVNVAVNAVATSEVELPAGELDDYRVQGANANDLGTIEKLVNIDDRLYAVVASGGFFGLGASQTAIPLSSLVISGSGLLAPNITQSQLDSLQNFDDSGYPALPQDHLVTIGSL